MKRQKQLPNIAQSKRQMEKIFEEEEAVSKAFDINNFYTNQRLNIVQLKKKLDQFKRNNKQSQPPQSTQTPKKPMSIFNQFSFNEEERDPHIHSTAKFIADSSLPKTVYHKQKTPSIVQRMNTPKTQYQSLKPIKPIEVQFKKKANVENLQKTYSLERKEEAKQKNCRIINQIQKERYSTKTKTAFGVRKHEIHSNHSNNTRVRSKMQGKSHYDKPDYSRCSGNSNNNWSQLRLQGRISIFQQHNIREIQTRIHILWQHYQLLTKILMGLKQGTIQQKNAIVKYVEDICSDKFQFVKNIFNSIQKQNPMKNQASFMKRLKKTLILSKIFENLSILYVSMNICLRQKSESHLVNFVGYCCSNIIFLLRFVQLCHYIEPPLRISETTSNILAVITQFENQSYKTKIQKMSDLVLKMQNNNEIISIVHNRLCNKMNKQFQQTINSLFKNVDLDSKPFYQYAHYIYEFLAFHLARLRIFGEFSFVEIAPTPYLSMPKKRTIVIQPWQVIFAFKQSTTFIRAYSQTFLTQLGKSCNIVFWTDLMPDKIDDLIFRLPHSFTLYQYHCRYENERFIKMLWRIGCDVQNTIIIDRDQANFKYDKEMGIQLPWRGKSKDSKLLEVLNLLQPLLKNDNQPFRKLFPLVKQQIIESFQKKNKKRLITKIAEENYQNYDNKYKQAKNNRIQIQQY